MPCIAQRPCSERRPVRMRSGKETRGGKLRTGQAMCPSSTRRGAAAPRVAGRPGGTIDRDRCMRLQGLSPFLVVARGTAGARVAASVRLRCSALEPIPRIGQAEKRHLTRLLLLVPLIASLHNRRPFASPAKPRMKDYDLVALGEPMIEFN